jgi:ATP-dependent Lhr-like helicase
VLAGAALEERDASEVIPAALREPAVERRVALREIVARWIGLAGPVTVAEARARYAVPARWLRARLEEWERAGRLVRGRFRPEVSAPEWCARRVVEMARRRALAAQRRQVEAAELTAFAGFLHRWQHLDPRDRLDGASGLEVVVRQLAGLPRAAAAWERDYLPARLRGYDPSWLAQLAASGRLVWAGTPAVDRRSGVIALAAVRFFERGEGGLWLAPDDDGLALSRDAIAVRDALARLGASFLPDLAAATGLGAVALRDALRELVAAGLATNDTIEALREVARARPLPDRARPGAAPPDPTRWLPADFTPSADRYVVQRRPNLRRLPKWRRPDLPVASGWVGRWALVRTPGTLGPPRDEDEAAERVARAWLARYGIVARDWWRRERPAVSWRAIYRELRRLEMRGDVRRGYFVRGLAGAQFALPDAVERLRLAAAEAAEPGSAPFVVMAASDPANPYSLPPDPIALAARAAGDAGAAETAPRPPALTRPRGRGALLVTRAGRVAIAAEGRGRRIDIAPDLSPDEVAAAARALGAYVARTASTARGSELVVESIGGASALASPHAAALRTAGFRVETGGLRWWGGE